MFHLLLVSLLGVDCPAGVSCSTLLLLAQAEPAGAASESAEQDTGSAPGDFNAWLRAGVGTLRQGQPETALTSLERALELAEDEADRLKALAFRALALLRLGRTEEALKESRALLARPAAGMRESAPRPALAVAGLVEGFAHARLGRPEEAERVLRETLEEYGAEPDLEDLLAEAWLVQGDMLTLLMRPREALESYQRAARPPSPGWELEERRQLLIGRALQAQALTLARLDRRDEQLEVLEYFLERYAAGVPSPALQSLATRMLLQQSQVLESNGELAQAAQTLQTLAEAGEDSRLEEVRVRAARARLRQGWLLRRLERHEEALELYAVLVERYSAATPVMLRRLVAEARIQRAATLVETRRPGAARETLRDLEQSLQDDEEGALRAYALRSLLLRGEHEEWEGEGEEKATAEERRLAAFERVQRRFSADPSPRVQERLLDVAEYQAELLAAAQRLPEALEVLEEAAARHAESEDAKLQEASARLFIGKSRLLERAGLTVEALQAIQQALQRFTGKLPAQTQARIQLETHQGLLLYRMQDWEKAIDVLEPLLQLQASATTFSDATRAALAAAWLYRNIAAAIAGRLREAADSLDGMIQEFLLDPAPEVRHLVILAHLHRSQMLLQLQQSGKGIKLLEAALERYGKESHPLLQQTVVELRMEWATLVAHGDRAAGIQAFQEISEHYAEAATPVLRGHGAAALMGGAELLQEAGRTDEAEQQVGRAVRILREIQSPFLGEAEELLRSLQAGEPLR